MNLDDFQKEAKRTRVFKITQSETQSTLARHYLLAGLTAQVGEIANRLKKRMRDGEDYVLLKDEIAERIGYALWYIAVLADEFGLQLDEIAQDNVEFNNRRWHQLVDPPPLISPKDFDSTFPADQQLPSKLIAQFETTPVNELRKTTVWIYPDWPRRAPRHQFGDPLDDNSTIEDQYRYHDIYHFAYLVFLNWSPVVRGLLKRKRKSDRNVDRIQDGARARDTEEASTAFIYSYVSQQNYLKTSTNVDTGVLTTVRTLLRAYEVNACAEKDWEAAILTATSVLRNLVENQGGWVAADRTKRTLSYLRREPPGLGVK